MIIPPTKLVDILWEANLLKVNPIINMVDAKSIKHIPDTGLPEGYLKLLQNEMSVAKKLRLGGGDGKFLLLDESFIATEQNYPEGDQRNEGLWCCAVPIVKEEQIENGGLIFTEGSFYFYVKLDAIVTEVIAERGWDQV